MSYPGLRRAERRIELDRGTWADRETFVLEFDFIAPGSEVSETQTFPVVFEGFPDFSYGVELQEGGELVPGDFPQVNAGVALWDQTFPETGALPRVMGAQVFVLALCSTAYRLRFRFAFSGVIFRNSSLLGATETPL